MNLSIALLQLAPCSSEKETLQVGIQKCIEAKALNAEIILFPEMWNISYQLPNNETEVETWKLKAIDEESSFIKEYCKIAQELKIIIAITYLEKTETLPRNTVAIIDKNGAIVHKYSKVHTCDFSSERWCSPGDDFPVTTIQTSIGPVKIGTMICFDREYPESARVLMLNGAELILIPNACEIEQNRKSQLQTRAFENMLGVALANYTSPLGNGHSIAFDGIAFEYNNATNTSTSRNHLILEAGEAEGIYTINLPIEKLRAYRKQEVWGNAYRKVEKYTGLLSSKVHAPFLRDDRRNG